MGALATPFRCFITLPIIFNFILSFANFHFSALCRNKVGMSCPVFVVLVEAVLSLPDCLTEERLSCCFFALQLRFFVSQSEPQIL